jgi:hypothetical protein
MFENFTEQALDVIALAKQEMRAMAGMHKDGQLVSLIAEAIVIVAVGYMLDEVNSI